MILGPIIGKMIFSELPGVKAIFNQLVNWQDSFYAGSKFFMLNNYSIQFVFYFTSINLQILLAFLTAAFFLSMKTVEGLKFHDNFIDHK